MAVHFHFISQVSDGWNDGDFHPVSRVAQSDDSDAVVLDLACGVRLGWAVLDAAASRRTASTVAVICIGSILSLTGGGTQT